MLEYKYEVRDPIYGFIPFTLLEHKVIAEPSFQRLRRIGQLALTHFVYPGATHSRFSHSLGVMHMASLMFESIVKSSGDILKEEFGFDGDSLSHMHQTVRLAALLHDIGHGPFSHASEGVMPFDESTKRRYNHEDYTVAIIRSKIKPLLSDSPQRIDVNSVTDLIDRQGLSLREWGLFFKSIVSSQLDADRADYLLRDSYHCGVKYGVYDHARLVNSLAVGHDQDNFIRVGIKEESWKIAESLVLARYWIHSYVYFHKTRRILDYHLEEAIKYIYKGEELPKPDELDDFLSLDDGSIWEKMKRHKENPHCDAILNRNHYRMVYSTNQSQLEEDNIKFEKVKQVLKENDLVMYVDENPSTYYKSDTKDRSFIKRDKLFDPKEIFIIREKNQFIIPLAERSTFLAKLSDEIKVKNIYVKPDQKEFAKKLIGGIG